MQRRLDSFPDELEKYFANMIDRIDKIHREETARIFLVNVEAAAPAPLFSLKYLSMEATDPDYAFKMEMSQISSQEALQIKRKWTKLLNSRCRDLLKVRTMSREHSYFLDYRVFFLHRTVKDFLRNNFEGELQKCAGDEFNVRTSLCNTIIALSKASVDLPLDTLLHDPPDLISPNFDLVDEFLYHARDLERKDSRSTACLLDELDRVNRIKFKGCHWTNAREAPAQEEYMYKNALTPLNLQPTLQEHESCTFLALAIQAGLPGYVKEKLEFNKELISQKRGRPLLDYALRPRIRSPILSLLGDDILDPHMVRLLLDQGSDPNQEIGIYDGYTIWSLFLSYCCWDYQFVSERNNEFNTTVRYLGDAWYDIIELMIDHGADLTIRVQLGEFENRNISMIATKTIKEILEFFFFGEDKAARLRLRIEEVAQRNRSHTSLFWRLLEWK